ncbi:DUF1851 domain-containing protein [Duganella sp. FT92W]|uniref:DUF1851 domain-containing protein n=1 Tax=Pseudoduganella rivuli TaxID=2666085 RepID=A0A7X2IUV6_9BURK|nr:GAD-like domain-containing protein [Pseudoduganella rivuli]MRV75923.1 DUF1851 domain-containing protein [Pseudoduganella rivuli]
MDEDFEFFLAKMGPDIHRRPVPLSSIERYRGKLPDQLLAYWQEHGWCGYADGLFWTVDPQEYEPVLEAWIGDTSFMEKDAYHIIARSAFGKLYLWGERTGHSLKIFAPGTYCFPSDEVAPDDDLDFELRMFFGARKRKENDFADLFAPAMNKLGPLGYDDMYGFVPALALCGPSDLAHLQKVKAVEHLVFLAQLAPLEVMTPP